jgi:hypothetical protein
MRVRRMHACTHAPSVPGQWAGGATGTRVPHGSPGAGTIRLREAAVEYASLEASSGFLRPVQVPWATNAAPRDGVFCPDYALPAIV